MHDRRELRKSFQALAPERIRGRVSMFMDSYVYSVGTIAGSMLIGIIVFAASAERDGSTSMSIWASV
ncbi:MAG: hypothetical protein R2838_07090 [Caldilineaceae bacterium]